MKELADEGMTMVVVTTRWVSPARSVTARRHGARCHRRGRTAIADLRRATQSGNASVPQPRAHPLDRSGGFDAGQRPAARYDVVIVGAGIAGLTAAWRLRDRNILVLEAADIVGGRLKTMTRPTVLAEPRRPCADGERADGCSCRGGRRPAHRATRQFSCCRDARPYRADQGRRRDAVPPSAVAGRPHFARENRAKLLAARRCDQAKLEAMSFAEFLGPMHPDVRALMRVVANRLTGELDDISALVGINGFDHLWLGSRLNIVGGSAELPFAIESVLGERVVVGAAVRRISQTPTEVVIEYEYDGGRSPSWRRAASSPSRHR